MKTSEMPLHDPRRREYFFHTKEGTFWILWRNGYWRPVFDNEDLGSYHTPIEAAEELGAGHCFLPSTGADAEALGVPCDIDDWEWRVVGS